MKNVADIWALTPMQERILAQSLDATTPGSFVEQLHCTLTGPLDVARFKRAWESVIARHALLRAAPAWQGLRKAIQVIRREVTPAWEQLDWRGNASADRLARQQELMADVRARGLDLSKLPLMSFHLVRLANDEHLFLWTCHHLLLDGWSLGIVLREVFQAYMQAPEAGPTATGSFADYLKWLAAQDPQQGAAFWRKELASPSWSSAAPLAVSKKHHIPGEQHGHCERVLSETDSDRLRRLAAANRVGSSTIVQAAWAIVLARYAECDDVMFGVTVSGRPAELRNVEAVVGPFSNAIPLRLNVDTQACLPELFRRLQEALIESQPFGHWPSEQIAEVADQAGKRLFRTLVVFENYPWQGDGSWQVADLQVSHVHGTTSSRCPLTLVVLPGRSWTLRLMYDARHYQPATADRLLQQVAMLLGGMTARPDAQVRELALVDPQCEAVPQWRDERGGRLHVLDTAGQPAPVDMPADLSIDEPTGDAGVKQRKVGYRAAWTSDGSIEYLGPSLHVEGRADRLRIGRYTVEPGEVAAVLRLHPGVTRAVVVGQADADDEIFLAAYIVPSQKTSMAISRSQDHLLLSELRHYVEDRLPEWMVPVAWRALDALPVDDAGQLDITALPLLRLPRRDLPQSYIPARDDLESQVAAVWSEVLGVEPIGVCDSFLDLGGNSSMAVSLLAQIETRFGKQLPLAALFERPTVESMAQLLRTHAHGKDQELLVPIRVSGKQSPLFCVHPAGGTVFCYRELANRLNADVPIFGLQALGIDGLSAPRESIEAMAADYCSAILTVQPSGPYRLCGWSTGGVIAFETARQLLAAGEEVALVALLDAAIPGPDQNLGESDLVPMLAMMFPDEDPARLRELRARPVAEQVEYFRHRAEAVRLLVAGSGARGVRAVFDVFEANVKAVVGYQPQPLHAPLMLICAAQHATPMHARPLLGWGDWAAGGAETHEVPGDHLSMLEPPTVASVAEILNRCLSGNGPQMQTIALGCVSVDV